MVAVERHNGRGWRREGVCGSRSEALQLIERLRATYGRRAKFRIIPR